MTYDLLIALIAIITLVIYGFSVVYNNIINTKRKREAAYNKLIDIKSENNNVDIQNDSVIGTFKCKKDDPDLLI